MRMLRRFLFAVHRAWRQWLARRSRRLHAVQLAGDLVPVTRQGAVVGVEMICAVGQKAAVLGEHDEQQAVAGFMPC